MPLSKKYLPYMTFVLDKTSKSFSNLSVSLSVCLSVSLSLSPSHTHTHADTGGEKIAGKSFKIEASDVSWTSSSAML
jgi:hypothetical protein